MIPKINLLLPNTYKQLIILLISIFFISSGILKLISIDDFEIYIYSFGILNFVTISLLSRLLISIEIILGLIILLNIHYKKAWILMLFSMISFSIFLVYIEFFRDDSNCFCMGSVVELNPISSLIKNIVVIILLLFIKQEPNFAINYKRIFFIITISILLLSSFIITPPYPALTKILKSENLLNKTEFEKYIEINKNSNNLLENIFINQQSDIIEFDKKISNISYASKEAHLLGFIHPGCQFCQLAINKLELIFSQQQLNKKQVDIFIWGDDSQIAIFLEKTKALDFNYLIIDANSAINITYGKFPSFAIIKENIIIHEFDYTSIDEKIILTEIKKADN